MGRRRSSLHMHYGVHRHTARAGRHECLLLLLRTIVCNGSGQVVLQRCLAADARVSHLERVLRKPLLRERRAAAARACAPRVQVDQQPAAGLL